MLHGAPHIQTPHIAVRRDAVLTVRRSPRLVQWSMMWTCVWVVRCVGVAKEAERGRGPGREGAGADLSAFNLIKTYTTL